MATTKRCTKCNTTKPVEEFNKRSSSKDGLDSHCKVCHRVYTAAYAKAHPEKMRESCRKYFESHPEKRLGPNGDAEAYARQMARWKVKAEKMQELARENGCECCTSHNTKDGPFAWHHHKKSEKAFSIGKDGSRSLVKLIAEAMKPTVHVLCNECHGKVEALLQGKKLQRPDPMVEAFMKAHEDEVD